MNYSIYIKYHDNTGAYLSVKGKTQWKIRTAKKHLKDVVTEKVQDDVKWKDVRYFAIVTI
ncbi:MAG: hypothetical protein LC100_15330 [Chitinophagales bacterium]|nr:hypothetical protein [Chitinophagales bacterium]